MKLLIVGNSHAYALKHAHDMPGSRFAGDMTFLCAPDKGLDLAIDNGRMRCVGAGAHALYADCVSRPEMVIDEHDMVVVVGLALQPYQALRLHKRGYRLFPHTSEGKVLLSRAAFAAALTGLMNDCMAIRTASLLRRHTTRPMILVPQPMPLARLALTPRTARAEALAERWRPFLSEPALGRELEQLFETATARHGTRLGFQFAAQPASTRDGLFTRDDCGIRHQSAFDPMTRRALEQDDLNHMNADYGRAVLAQLGEMIAGPVDGQGKA